MGRLRQQPWWFPHFGQLPRSQQPIPRALVRQQKDLTSLAYAVLAVVCMFLLPQAALGFPIFLGLQLLGHVLAYALLAFPFQVLLDLIEALLTISHIEQHILLPATNLLLLTIQSTCHALLGYQPGFSLASANTLCKEHLSSV
jgi:hypothetical protein